MTRIASTLQVLLLAVWLGAACEDGSDPTALVGEMLDMTVDTKVLSGLPALAVDNVTFAAGSPTDLTATLRFLEPLSGSAYHLFLVSLDGTRAVPASGRYRTTRADSVRVSRDSIAVTVTTEERGVQSSTAGAPNNVTHTFVIQEGDIAPNVLDDFAFLVVAVQGGGATLESSAPAPLWFRFRNPAAAANSASAWLTGTGSFGRFSASAPYVFEAGGTGLGAFYTNGTADFGDDRLVVNLRRMPRPPLGYMYAAWLVRADNTAAPAGTFTSPFPELASLETADAASPSVVIQENEIVEATVRGDQNIAGAAFHEFAQFILTLELKAGGAGKGPAHVVGADLPGALAERRPRVQ